MGQLHRMIWLTLVLEIEYIFLEIEVRSKCHTHPDKNKGLRFSNAIFSFGDLNDGELCRTLTLCYQFPDLQIKKNGKLIHVMKLKSLLNPFLKGGVHKLCLQNLSFFDHLPPSVYIFYGIKVYKKSIFLTTYPPPLVNVVCERPLRLLW